MTQADMLRQADLPEYSVLLSVYHRDTPQWFERAVDSMAGQSLPPREIVIVEDGALTEALYAAEQRCIARYPSLVRIVTLPENQGLATAMNHGLAHCRCEWIARMDADDVSAPARCEEELRLAMAEQADIVGCDCEEFLEDIAQPAAKRLFPATHDELVRFSRRRTPFCHPAVMMRKSAVQAAGNYRDVYLHEDYDLFVRMLSCGSRGCSVKRILYHVRIGREFYARRGGARYVGALLRFNVHLLATGWMKPADFIMRSCGNILIGLAPVGVRSWCYRRLLRK
ncbi:MAG: glycosyltransferase [Aristaeellaceae bacterium]